MKKESIKNLVTPILALIVLLIGIFLIFRPPRPSKPAGLSVVSSGFIGYDFVRAIAGDHADVKMLLKPGAEAHAYEPTPQDIIDLKNADLFVYVGGDSDEWVKKLLSANEISADKTLRLMDLVELKEEETVEGMEEEHEHEHGHEHEHNHEGHDHAEEEPEYDEHIWTSPKNCAKIAKALMERLTKIAPAYDLEFAENQQKFNVQLEALDQLFRETIANSSKKLLIFGDRFPFRYFVDEYDLKYYAAFPGCSEQTEASASTIAFLINKVKENNIKVVLKIELTSGALAETIAAETGAKVLEFSAAHNISEADFTNGITYLDLMAKNVAVLKEALE